MIYSLHLYSPAPLIYILSADCFLNVMRILCDVTDIFFVKLTQFNFIADQINHIIIIINII